MAAKAGNLSIGSGNDDMLAGRWDNGGDEEGGGKRAGGLRADGARSAGGAEDYRCEPTE